MPTTRPRTLPLAPSRIPAPAPTRSPRPWPDLPVEAQAQTARLLAELLRRLRPACRPVIEESRRAERIEHP